MSVHIMFVEYNDCLQEWDGKEHNILQTLLNENNIIDIHTPDNDGKILLHLAVEYNIQEIFYALFCITQLDMNIEDILL